MHVEPWLETGTTVKRPYKETFLVLLKYFGCRNRIRTDDLKGYEPCKLPLLHPAPKS